MKQALSIEERAISLAHYIIDSKDTVRGAAKKFGISKSTVHTEVTIKNGYYKALKVTCEKFDMGAEDNFKNYCKKITLLIKYYLITLN